MSSKPTLRKGETLRDYFTGLGDFYEDLALELGDVLARRHEDRGQIDHTLEYWSMWQGRKNKHIDSMWVQAYLKSPMAGHAEMLPPQKRWAADHAISLPDDDFVRFRPYDGERKIRVGYCCCWFDSSTIRGQGIPFIAEHDRYKFSVVGYSLGPCDRSVTKHFDDFFDIGALSDKEFARKVREDEIDILMEFTGFSPHHRYGAMGARLAPIQISYLNHAGTCGVPNVDYVLADEIAAPAGIDRWFTEEIWRLPSTFFCFNYDWDVFPPIAPPPHLKNGYITFGCFGSQSKINDAVIKLWADVLHTVPDSRLFLRNMGLANLDNRKFMERRFARFGIPSTRLRLQPGGTREDIKANYNEVDISFDTWPYCGGNTIAESQWMGVPVISLKGDRFPAAYGASLLNASGCADLVAETPADFIRISAALAADSKRIVHYRDSLRQMMVDHGFGDAARFARVLETAYEAMMHRAFAPKGQPS